MPLIVGFSHSVRIFETSNMTPVKFLIALAAVYDGILYVLQPPDCTSASFAYDDAVHNVTWRKMDNVSLANISTFKIPVKNFTENGVLTFKIKFHYPTHAVDTNWQTILLKNKKSDVLKKLVQPEDDSCCIATVIVSVVLLIVLSMCIAYFIIIWSHHHLR